MACKNIKIPLVGQSVYLYHGDDGKKQFEKHAGEEIEDNAKAAANGNGVVFLRDVVALSSIAHETSHLVDSLMRHIGAKEEDELKAYATGFIMQKLYKALKLADVEINLMS